MQTQSGAHPRSAIRSGAVGLAASRADRLPRPEHLTGSGGGALLLDVHVDVNVRIRTQDTTGLAALDQTEFSQHLDSPMRRLATDLRPPATPAAFGRSRASSLVVKQALLPRCWRGVHAHRQRFA